jgi:SOS-response transcriptional repressor LexA
MDIGKRIHQLRKMRGITQAQLGQQLNLTQNTISNIEKAFRRVPTEELPKFAQALGVTVAQLVSEEAPNCVPLLSLEACCGPFREAWDDVLEWVPVPPGEFHETRYFLQAKGDSMAPTICDGERILVDRALQPENGNIVVAVSGGECTINRFYRYGRRIQLKPDNQQYPTLVVTPDVDLEIRGVVVLVHKALLETGGNGGEKEAAEAAETSETPKRWVLTPPKEVVRDYGARLKPLLEKHQLSVGEIVKKAGGRISADEVKQVIVTGKCSSARLAFHIAEALGEDVEKVIE